MNEEKIIKKCDRANCKHLLTKGMTIIVLVGLQHGFKVWFQSGGQVAEWSEWTLRSSTLSEKSVVQILVRVQTEFIYKYNVLRFEMSMNIQCCCYPSTGNQSNANIGQAGSQLEVRRQGEYQSFVT